MPIIVTNKKRKKDPENEAEKSDTEREKKNSNK